MGRAFEFIKARKMKRWSAMAKTFTRIGKDIVMAVKLSLLLVVYLSSPIIVAQSYNEYVTAEVYFLDGTRKDGLALVKPSSCLLYTSPSPRDRTRSRMPSSA